MITVKDFTFTKHEGFDTTYSVSIHLEESVKACHKLDCVKADNDLARSLVHKLLHRIYGEALSELEELQTRLKHRTDIVAEPEFHSRFVRLRMLLEGRPVT